MVPITESQSSTMLGLLDRAEAEGADFGAAFYAEMLGTHPEIRRYFSGGLATQVTKMNAMLRSLVTLATVPRGLERPLRDLARRHVVYGVAAEHYVIAERALMRALWRLDGVEVTPEEYAAWSALAFDVSALMMQETLNQTV